QGTLSDLTHQPAFDESAVCAAYIVPQPGAGGMAGGLWRLGGALSAVNLQDAQGHALGKLQSVLLDLNGGQAVYAIVDTSTYLAGTPAAASTVTPGAASTSSGTGAGGASSAGNCGPTGTGSLGTPTVTAVANAAASAAVTQRPTL